VREDDDVLGSDSLLLRHDFERGTCETRSFGPGAQLGEAVFVPQGDDAAEGDGWVLTLVYDAAQATSGLWILDAEDLAGDPQAVIELPQRVPAGFHGNWVPDPA